MLRGFRWLALAAAVAIAALAGPAAALASGCGDGSATSIYSECTPSASGTQHHKSGGTKPPVVTQPTYTQPYVQPTTHPPRVKHVQTHHHTASHPGVHPQVVVQKHIKPVLADAPTAATGGSTFDLGTGPTAFFVLLLGTVLVLVGTGGVRSWRNRHRV